MHAHYRISFTVLLIVSYVYLVIIYRNEMAAVYLLKSYCLPPLVGLYVVV